MERLRPFALALVTIVVVYGLLAWALAPAPDPDVGELTARLIAVLTGLFVFAANKLD